MSQPLTNMQSETRSKPRTARKPRKQRLVKVDKTDDDPNVGLSDSLSSYDAIAVYFSFVFHLSALAAVILVLWMLDLLYLPTFDKVDPLRAALADETVLDDEPLMETEPLQIQTPDTVEVKEDSAVSIAKAINEESLNAADILSSVTGTKGNDGTPGLNAFLPRGGNAVTEGSFTAWTVPENPGPNDTYMIVIEVKLPEEIKIYRLTDLTGVVVGTDNYKQQLPWDNNPRVQKYWPYPHRVKNERAVKIGWQDRKDRIRVNDHKLQMFFKIPGGNRSIRDRITLRSKVLKEEQELELVFGAAKKKDDRTP